MGVLWQESCFSPFYALVDTVMDRRAETVNENTQLLSINRGSWCGYVLLSSNNKEWQEAFAKDVSVEEWQDAKIAYKFFVSKILSGINIYEDVFYWDDCTSLSDFANLVAESTYEEFQAYWVQTIATNKQ